MAYGGTSYGEPGWLWEIYGLFRGTANSFSHNRVNRDRLFKNGINTTDWSLTDREDKRNQWIHPDYGN